MKVAISKKQLVAALKTVQPAVARRATLPILSGVRLEAAIDRLSLEATDLEVAVRRDITEKIDLAEDGALVVPAKALGKAVTSMPDGEVTLTARATDGPIRLTLMAGSRTVALEGMTAEDWPQMPDPADGSLVASMPAKDLADAFARVALCVSSDEARPVLTGVAIFVDGDARTIQLVATDSYRLGAISLAIAGKARGSDSPLIVPAHAVRALAKAVRKSRGSIAIRLIDGTNTTGSRSVAFCIDGIVWVTRVIEGEFPNWRQIVPEPGQGARLDVDAAELENALKAAEAVRSNGGVPVRLSLGETCDLVVSERDIGEMRATLSGARFSPDGVGSFDIAFNPAYLADALRFLGTERVEMWARDGLKPALLGTPDRRYVLMPVRIS